MTRRLAVALLLPAAAAIAAIAIFAPPVVPPQAPPSYIAVDPGGAPVEAGDGRRITTSTLYSGEVGPARPIEVASVDVATGRYLLRLLIAGRYSALTEEALNCYLVEQKSGIALEPQLTLTLAREDGWVTVRSDAPMSLPAMTVAASCTTMSTSFGRLELLQATLVAEQLG